MTRADWDAFIQRWMHRNDLSGDLDKIHDMSAERVDGDWLGTVPWATDDERLSQVPNAMRHAGLMFCGELTQDDEQIMREAGLLQAAIENSRLAYSINNVTAEMENPYGT